MVRLILGQVAAHSLNNSDTHAIDAHFGCLCAVVFQPPRDFLLLYFLDAAYDENALVRLFCICHILAVTAIFVFFDIEIRFYRSNGGDSRVFAARTCFLPLFDSRCAAA